MAAHSIRRLEAYVGNEFLYSPKARGFPELQSEVIASGIETGASMLL
jgi:hypothetical protein